LTHISGVQHSAWYASVSYWLILFSSHSLGEKRSEASIVSGGIDHILNDYNGQQRVIADEWKEEKYLRHYTIAHVLRTINCRWFEREGEREREKNQANRKIPLVTTCIKKRRRDEEREICGFKCSDCVIECIRVPQDVLNSFAAMVLHHMQSD
jgi:hypothetical protein